MLITSTLIQQMSANTTKFNSHWAGRAPAERCKMTVLIYFDFRFFDGTAEASAGSAFSSNFWLFVLTSFRFSLLQASSLPLPDSTWPFQSWDMQLLLLVNQPWHLKTGQPTTYLCLMTAAHQPFVLHLLPPVPSCLSPLSLNNLVSFHSFFWSLFLRSTSSAFNFSSAYFLFLSASSLSSHFICCTQ